MTPPTTIRLFIKPYCGWCLEVIGWLKRHNLTYEQLNVTDDKQAWKEMTALSGQTMAPVIEVDGHVLADFGADELDAWWKQMGFGFPQG